MQEIKMNIAYRRFLGHTLNEELPHSFTVSYNFKHRVTEETVEQALSWILQEANSVGYLEPEAVFVDGTHIKTNANINKKIKRKAPQAAKRYALELMEEVNADREAHEKKPLEDSNSSPTSKRKCDNASRKKLARRKREAKRRELTVSKTDPQKRACFKRANTRSALLTKRILPATNTISFLMLRWLQGTYMTAWCSTQYMTKWQGGFLKLKQW